MPILDPLFQLYFVDKISGDASKKYSKQFFLRYLKIASRNMYRNPKTIEASIQFKKDFKKSIEFLNKEFGCDFTNNFDDSTIKDYYRYLYDHISPKYKTKILKNLKGKYQCFYEKTKMNVFQPYVDIPSCHGWYFTTNPIAILSIDERSFSYRFKQADIESLVKLVNLEIDLMNAAGFTVVICLNIHLKNEYFPLYINEILATHSFAELHLTAKISEKDEPELVDKFFQGILDIYDNIKGYFYYYSKFLKDKFDNSKKIFKQIKKKPRFRYIFFSKRPYIALRSINDNNTKPFPFCKTGFEDDKICVKLSNVPLYKSEDDDEDFISSDITGLSEGFILANDFLNSEKNRVKILFNDLSKNGSHIERYINFDDLHSIKPDLYVDDTMYLVNTEEKTLEIVDKIESEIIDKNLKYDDFKKESIFSFFKDKKMQKGLSYVSYAYKKSIEKIIPHFNMHTNQIFTAFEACRTCIFEEKNTSKGVVYQVETGEGKSCIIQVIAAVLALMKKTVHITSSNIQLANRDYYDSYHFFRMLGLSSAVLLHYNELPYVSFKKSTTNSASYDKKYFPSKFFGSKLFKNSSNMNFSVCGISNDNEVVKDRANVIFSTFVNFESLYLRMMEMCPGYIDDYFKSCSLLIDEADSILIDELTNGTILSRTVKTNANAILEYVYQSQKKKEPSSDKNQDEIKPKSAIEVFNYVKKTWPECVDLKLKDIQFMIEEIELVNNPEFIDGRKYSIEEIEIEEDTSIFEAVKKAYQTGKIKVKRLKSKFLSKIFNKNKNNANDDKEKNKNKNKKRKRQR